MNVITERRSIRKYTDKAVSREDLSKIVQAGILAPSAKNRQPWKYIVFTGNSKDHLLNEMEKGLLREKNGKKLLPKSQTNLPDAFHTLEIMREAPVLIMVENHNGSSPYQNIDSDARVTEICDTLSIGASIQNMLLTATELGYGTLWIANTCFAYNELVDYMGISGQLVGAVLLGHPNEHPNPRPRKNIKDVVEYR
ncbi:MAG: nitroreductase family protein [Candidatus Gastranaerophilales bacterium]|nr:nitroreductase family protein [Candidatus Gastranaerophilales bacterium]